MEENKKNNFTLTWLPKKTFEILAIVPWNEITSARKQAITKAGEEIEIKGFRKGKAPENLVVENIGLNKLLDLTLDKIIPEIYTNAVKQFGLRPIVSPKIELVSAKENEDWQIKFVSCEEPEVKLGEYKDQIKKMKTLDSIWTPDKGTDLNKKDKPAKDENEEREAKLEKIIKWFTENIKFEISDLILESEVNRKLSELLEQTQKLGLTIDQYLSSTGKTIEAIRQEYKIQAERTLTLQLILGAVAEQEKIEVKDEDIEKALSSAKNEEEKKALEAQKYLIASIIRQQKTLDFLADLV